MRTKIEFEQLVYEKADILSARERRHTVYRRYLSAAAAITLITAAALTNNSFSMTKLLNSPISKIQSYENNTADNIQGNITSSSDELSLDNAAVPNEQCDEAFEANGEMPFNSVPKAVEPPKSDSIDNNDNFAADTHTETNENTVKVIFDLSSADHFEITDPENAQQIISQLRSAEQIRQFTNVKGEYLGTITTVVTSEKMIQYKEYLIFENTVTVSVHTLNNEENNESNTSYSFGTSEQFLKIIEEYSSNH